ncbi:hypothetical protein SAMN05443572_104565 [Myxococcus fulvus]|uniref:Lipoprotein n=2 Tax=Myxococcus fulvus TaxID=33 RepID=A0ABY1CHJ7_MYXFU|nr:hypothetical protein SAMN05443572_104565 [Myxococcus fulvus]
MAPRVPSLRDMERISGWGRAAGVLATGLLATGAWACDTCRPRVEAGIYNEHFLGRLALTLMPLLVVLWLVVLIVWSPWSDARPRASSRRSFTQEESS